MWTPTGALSQLSTTEGPLLLGATPVPLCKAPSSATLTGAVCRQVQVPGAGEAGAGMGREEEHTAGISTDKMCTETRYSVDIICVCL